MLILTSWSKALLIIVFISILVSQYGISNATKTLVIILIGILLYTLWVKNPTV